MNKLKDAISTRQPDAGARETINEGREDRDEIRLNVRMKPGLYRKLKDRAEGEGRSISWVVRTYVQHYANGGDLP